MTQETITVAVSVLSFFISLISLFIAWKAFVRADRTYMLQVITQVYNKYNSPAMRQDLQSVWKIYHLAWQCVYKKDLNKATEKTNSGAPLSTDIAKELYRTLEIGSPEYRAIDNVLLFWDYIAILVSTKVLSIKDLSGFLTPRILGILYPIERAKANFYGYRVEAKSSLQVLYESWKRKSPDTF